MRHRVRKQLQQHALADQPLPVTSPAHAQHRPAGQPRILGPALAKHSPGKVHRDGRADDLQAGGRIVHPATVRRLQQVGAHVIRGGRAKPRTVPCRARTCAPCRRRQRPGLRGRPAIIADRHGAHAHRLPARGARNCVSGAGNEWTPWLAAGDVGSCHADRRHGAASGPSEPCRSAAGPSRFWHIFSVCLVGSGPHRRTLSPRGESCSTAWPARPD